MDEVDYFSVVCRCRWDAERRAPCTLMHLSGRQSEASIQTVTLNGRRVAHTASHSSRGAGTLRRCIGHAPDDRDVMFYGP